jgi:hypothetical protein
MAFPRRRAHSGWHDARSGLGLSRSKESIGATTALVLARQSLGACCGPACSTPVIAGGSSSGESGLRQDSASGPHWRFVGGSRIGAAQRPCHWPNLIHTVCIVISRSEWSRSHSGMITARCGLPRSAVRLLSGPLALPHRAHARSAREGVRCSALGAGAAPAVSQMARGDASTQSNYDEVKEVRPAEEQLRIARGTTAGGRRAFGFPAGRAGRPTAAPCVFLGC